MSATNIPSTRQSTKESTGIDLTSNHECITFVWLDLRRESTATFVGSLRAINDCVRTYTDMSTCLDAIQASRETIFLISSPVSVDYLSAVHQCITVEAIFILDPDTNPIRGEFPKLFGVFTQHEELLRVLRETFDTFEQMQLERFSFESEKIFLWWQLWKENITTRKPTVNSKNNLVEEARSYYRTNAKRLKLIDEFDKTYRSSDSLHWCFRLPFPSRLLRCALLSPIVESLPLYHFLIVDTTRTIHQESKRSGHGQLFRGMKLPNDLVDTFESHTGQLVCTNGFFMCSKMRNIELQSAALPGYRTDLSSVLFKIDFDAAARFAEVLMDNGSPVVVFDVATSFRIVCVNRGVMSIIKLKTAPDDGKKIALEYKDYNKGKTLQVLLDELLAPPKPPTPPPPPPPPPPKVEVRKEPILINESKISEDELQAEKYLESGDIDRAIMAYRRIRPVSVRILKIIGRLAMDKKEDYETAIECFELALKMQEDGGKNDVDTISRLGTCYYQRKEFDLTLKYHGRALFLYESARPRDTNSIAISLTAIANAHRARKELKEALDYAQRAWTLYEKAECEDHTVVATSLILLTNIHHELGDYAPALKVGTRALALIERTRSSNPVQTADLLNTLGLIQMNLGELSEASRYFEQALKTYSRMAPLRESEKDEVEKNLQCVLKMQQNTVKFQHYS